MFEPVRGGTRGGQAEFKWADVSADKDRENYLGHSINAPTGRWQKNKDVHWYNRDKKDDAAEQAEEIRKIKELEAEALAAALGYEPAKPGAKAAGATSSGANAVPVASTSNSANKYSDLDPDAAARKAEKEERRRLKEAKKEEKRAKKELKRLKKGGARDSAEMDDRPRRRSSRSLSPVRRVTDRPRSASRSRSRSRTPVRARRYPDDDKHGRDERDYDERERERERERHRLQWERNAQRDKPRDDRDRRRW